MYGDLDDSSPDLSSFRAVTLTVKSFFKQVSLYHWDVAHNLLSVAKLARQFGHAMQI